MSKSSESEPSLPHSRYTRTKRASYGSQQECADAWADDQYPVHNDGVLYSSPNFRGVQRDDGSGRLRHYRTREAIRTRNGLIINNHQCWADGFAHCSPPSDPDAVLPLSAIETIADHNQSYEIADVIGAVNTWEGYHGDTRSSVRPENTIAVFPAYDQSAADHEHYGVCVARDPSGLNRDSQYFVFRVDEDEIEFAREHGVEALIDAKLTPEAVTSSEYDVVHSGVYTKNHLDESEREAHLAAGGKVTGSRSRWRDEPVNRQFHRADLQGDSIVRHGEWFFIPAPNVSDDDVTPSCSCETYVSDDLGSHRTYDDSGRLDDGTPVVRGRVGHSDNDHNMIHLGDTWHKAVTHGVEALTYDPSPGTHGGGGGGYD